MDQRSTYAKTFALPDGSRRTRISTEPIHFKDDSGAWVEIDNTLIPNGSGGYINRANEFKVNFAGSGAAPNLLRVEFQGKSLSFGLEGAADVVPTIEGSDITYPDILPNADLTFQVRGEMVKELLILKSAPSLNEGQQWLDLRFPLSTSGLSVEEIADEVLLTPSSGGLMFLVPHLFMYDSAGLDQGLEPALSENIQLALGTQGGQRSLDVKVDANWLRDPARVYPVTIDPSLINDRRPTLDTFVQSNIDSSGQSGSSELKSGYYAEVEGTFRAQSLLKFDLSDIPTGSSIESATLQIFNNHSYNCNAARQTEVRRVDGSWGSNVTWPNKPPLAATAADVKTFAYGERCITGGKRVDWNVQSVVNYWKNTGAVNYGFGVRATDEEWDSNATWRKYASDDGTHTPWLDVTYSSNNSPNEPIPISPSSDSTTSGSPTLRATYRDPDANDSGWAEFEIYQAGTCCGNPFRSSYGSTVNPGGTSVWSPSNPLPHGNYVWRARGNDQQATSGWTTTIAFSADVVPPSAPGFTAVPSSPSNSLNPSWSFSGEAGASFQCRLTNAGAAVFDWSSCSSPKSYDLSGQNDATYTFEVRQTDKVGNGPSTPTASDYTLDRTGPAAPEITSEPSGPSTNMSPSWTFTGEAGAALQCQLTRGGAEVAGWSTCSSPKSYSLSGQGDGTYTFAVRQSDRAGNGPSGADTSNYTLDTTAPNPPTITSAPSSPSDNTSPSWSFQGESGGFFRCQLSSSSGVVSPYATCTSPANYDLSSQPDGTYTFSVYQVDTAGNQSAASSSSFVVVEVVGGQQVCASIPTRDSYEASDLPAFIPALCGLTGSRIRDHGIGLVVPPPGAATSGASSGPEGGEEFAIEADSAGNVRLLHVGNEMDEGALSLSSIPAIQPAYDRCTDSENNAGAVESDQREWALNLSSIPILGDLTYLDTEEAILRAHVNMTRKHNSCNLDQTSSGASYRYLGNTSRRADIDDGDRNDCSGWNDRDGNNTVDFGNLSHRTLGLNCTWYYTLIGEITESDIRLNSEDYDDHEWTNEPNSRLDCYGEFDVESVATHEVGHSYGLKHVEEHPGWDLTMSPLINGPCADGERQLGLGDWLGMVENY